MEDMVGRENRAKESEESGSSEYNVNRASGQTPTPHDRPLGRFPKKPRVILSIRKKWAAEIGVERIQGVTFGLLESDMNSLQLQLQLQLLWGVVVCDT